jgi:transaldolase
MSRLKEVQKLGQSIWLDFINRSLIKSGKLKALIDEGLAGITTNPTIFQKAITQSADYDEPIRAILKSNPSVTAKYLYDRLTTEDIQMAADILHPVYDASGGVDGMVSLEVSPHLAYDTRATIDEAERLCQRANRPNVMIKVPATPEGIPAIEELIARGINVNITLMFSLKHYEAISRAYLNGIARTANPARITSVASFFVSRVDTYVDKELEKIGTKEALALRGKAAVANSKVVYRRFREIFSGKEFTAQRNRGARVQRVLWGSTSTKNPAYADLLYVDNLIGPDTVNTLPMETLEAFRDHGRIERTVDKGLDEADKVLTELKKVGINLDKVTEQLQKDGVKAFADSFDQLLRALENKRTELLSKG